MLKHSLNKSSLKSDDEMTHLDDYNWLHKTPVWIWKWKWMFMFHFPLWVKIKMTIDTRTPFQFSSVLFVRCERGFIVVVVVVVMWTSRTVMSLKIAIISSQSVACLRRLAGIVHVSRRRWSNTGIVGGLECWLIRINSISMTKLVTSWSYQLSAL